MITAFRGQQVLFSVFVADEYGKAVDLSAGNNEEILWRVFFSESSYTQIEPLAGWNSLDLVASRISLGLYQISFTVPALAVVGEYSLEVERLKDSIILKEYRQEWEVVTSYLPELKSGGHLCLIRDLRSEGLPLTVSDMTLSRAINRGDSWLSRYCSRVFQPRIASFRLKCKTTGKIILPEPLCWLQSISTILGGDSISFDSITLFSRYLRQNNGGPGFGDDDRDNCKIESSSFSKNTEYWVTGVWGYSQADGSEVGCVPEQIRLCAINLGLKYQSSLMGSGSGAIPGFTDRLISEKTATQSYNLSPLDSGSQSMIAGDSELYRILKQYRRPAQMGWA